MPQGLLSWITFGIDASICDPIGPLQLEVVAELRTQIGAHQHCVEGAMVVHSMQAQIVASEICVLSSVTWLTLPIAELESVVRRWVTASVSQVNVKEGGQKERNGASKKSVGRQRTRETS